jgi:hypothetical protein
MLLVTYRSVISTSAQCSAPVRFGHRQTLRLYSFEVQIRFILQGDRNHSRYLHEEVTPRRPCAKKFSRAPAWIRTLQVQETI